MVYKYNNILKHKLVLLHIVYIILVKDAPQSLFCLESFLHCFFRGLVSKSQDNSYKPSNSHQFNVTAILSLRHTDIRSKRQANIQYTMTGIK